MLRSTCCGLLFALSLLTGCGGGGPSFVDNDDGDGSGSGGGGSTPTTVSRVILLASTTQLPSAADLPAEGVTLSAQALDASSNLISSSTISFAIPAGAGALVVAADDGSGTRTATLTTAGDPTPRSITVTASASGISTTLDINVTGTTLTLTGPDTIGFGQTGQYSAKLADSAGNGIGGQSVEFATTAGSIAPATATTATGTGVASATLTGSTSGNVTVQALGLSASSAVAISADQLSVEAPVSGATIPLNTSQTVSVLWLRNGSAAETAGATVDLSASRGTLANTTLTLDGTGRASTTISSTNAGGAVIVASSQQLGKPTATVPVEFVATTASSINVQASPATLPVSTTSVITAIVRDPTGNLVKGKQVDFKLTDISGGTLSAPSATTDSQGKASVTYAASNVSSADKGVRVDATVHDTSAVTGFVAFTVGGQALRITLGTGNEIQEPNQTTYDQPYSVIVTDSSGNPVTNATFRLSVLPTRYQKGYYQTVDTDDDGTDDAWGRVVTATCGNEDIDYDGVKDSGEDFNNNGILDPGNVASTPTTVTLDDNGAGEFLVRYPQDRASWVEVELRGVATVAGTETTSRAVFWLNVSADDVSDLKVSPPGAISPYGVGTSCSDPN